MILSGPRVLASSASPPGCDLLVILHTLTAEGCPQLALQLASYWQLHGLRVVIITLESQPNDLLSEFEKLGAPIYRFHLGHGLPRYLRLIYQSWSYCRRLKPHAVLSMPLGWHAFIAWGAWLAGVRRCCAHVGNLPPVGKGFPFQKFKLQVQIGRPVTQYLLCCSNYIRFATIRDFGVASHEAVTIYNACDLDVFASIPKRLSLHQPPKLLMVARLELHKDQPTLIRAAALLRDRGINVSVQLVGDGSLRLQLEDLVKDYGLEEVVTLLGMRRDIPELLADSDLFVFAAKPDEGFGIALAEAMAAAIPIIATDVGACSEVLAAGRFGLLVAPQDPESLASAIESFLADPDSSVERALAARRYAQRHFSISQMATAYLDALLGTSHPSCPSTLASTVSFSS